MQAPAVTRDQVLAKWLPRINTDLGDKAEYRQAQWEITRVYQQDPEASPQIERLAKWIGDLMDLHPEWLVLRDFEGNLCEPPPALSEDNIALESRVHATMHAMTVLDRHPAASTEEQVLALTDSLGELPFWEQRSIEEQFPDLEVFLKAVQNVSQKRKAMAEGASGASCSHA